MSYDHYASVLREAVNLDAGQPVPEPEIARFDGLVPEGLQEVWRRHGNQLVFKEGRVQLCDPRAVQAVLAPWFECDPELGLAQIVPYAITSLGDILLTENTLRSIFIHTSMSHLSIGRFSPSPSGETDLDFFLAHALSSECEGFVAWEGDDLHADGVARNGAPALGEMLGWDPALQLAEQVSETRKSKLKTFNALERIAYLRDLAPLELHRVFKDVFEAVPYGGETFVRFVGQPG